MLSLIASSNARAARILRVEADIGDGVWHLSPRALVARARIKAAFRADEASMSANLMRAAFGADKNQYAKPLNDLELAAGRTPVEDEAEGWPED